MVQGASLHHVYPGHWRWTVAHSMDLHGQWHTLCTLVRLVVAAIRHAQGALSTATQRSHLRSYRHAVVLILAAVWRRPLLVGQACVSGRQGGVSAKAMRCVQAVGVWQVRGACRSLGAGGGVVGTDAAGGGGPASSSLLSGGGTCLWDECVWESRCGGGCW